MKFGCNWLRLFQRRSRLKLWTDYGWMDDGRWTKKPAYTISSPGAFGSGELKINNFHFFPTQKPMSPNLTLA